MLITERNGVYSEVRIDYVHILSPHVLLQCNSFQDKMTHDFFFCARTQICQAQDGEHDFLSHDGTCIHVRTQQRCPSQECLTSLTYIQCLSIICRNNMADSWVNNGGSYSLERTSVARKCDTLVNVRRSLRCDTILVSSVTAIFTMYFHDTRVFLCVHQHCYLEIFACSISFQDWN